jgi:membrane protease YdiL (CAAX protease family)
MDRPLLPIGLFLVLTLAISSIFYTLIIGTGHAGGGRGAYAIGLMWSPGLAALLTCRLSKIPLNVLGWTWGAWRWPWLAYLIPFAYVTIAYGVVWQAGFGGFPDPEFIAWARKGLGWTTASDWVVVGGDFLLVATTGMVVHSAHALGEEIGWRGFLAPRMTETLGFTRGAITTGILWTVWHLPLLLFADYNNATPWWFGLTCFTVMVLSMSIIMAWLRQRSGNLWTAVIFHASHNLFIQSLFTPATLARGEITPYAIDEFGFAVPAFALVFALGILAYRRQTLGREEMQV